ncbi:MAG: FemAB family PEP-CTERM system-associated protein [Gemmatimonadetes bacterium]|nr:FemAB family PEP-CTERM system-associated protein [Gemmatimonadota bacterium]
MPTLGEADTRRLRVERYAGDAETWNDFVRLQGGWTHFHLFEWKNVIESVFGHECIYLAAFGGDGLLAGVLPLVRVRSRVFGHYLVSMPFVNYGGPLGDTGAVRELVDHAVRLANETDVDLLELRSRHRLDIPMDVSHRKITVLLDLPRDDHTLLWDNLKAKLRSQIRRPQKEGVTVRFGSDQVDPFYAVFARHMRDLGTPVQSLDLFKAIAAQFPDDAVFGCAYLSGRPVAAGCGFTWDSEFEMTWASSLQEYNKIAPNMLLYWSFMERAIENGLTTFNFGRCTPESSTHRFKRQWGSRDVPLYWYQHGARSARSTPSPDDARYAWGPRIWKHIPLRLANTLGPAIVRYIP